MAWTERYVRSDAAGGGDGTTNTNSGGTGAWTLAEAVAAVAAGHRVNVRAGTYANTTTTHTFATAGTTTAPIWWRGFTSTPGDLDAEPTTNRVPGTDTPHFTSTTGRLIFSGAYQMVSNLAATATGAINNSILNASGGTFKGHRLRIDNQSANASSRAVTSTSVNGNEFTACYFKATSTATSIVNYTSITTFHGCVFEGGGIGIDGNTSSLCVMGCVFNNPGSHGILSTGSQIVYVGNTFYSCGGDGISISTLPAATSLHIIANNIFSDNAAYGINNSTGANTANISRIGNLFYNNTTNKENGFGDMPSVAEQTDSSSPFTNAAGGDLSLVSTSNAKSKGVPGLFENQSYTSATDIGAVQIVEPTDAEIATAVWAYGNRTLT
jgi:hypothetical protein